MLTLDVLAFLFLYAIYRSWRRKQPSLPLPPGPKGFPLIGNLMDMPRELEWLTFHKWAKDFGTDILYLNVAGQNIVIIETAAAATELLEKRSSIYSGRPRLPMINELMGWSWNFATMDYGDSWRQHRRLTHSTFHPVASRQFLPHFSAATIRFLGRMLDDSEDLIGNIHSFTGDIVLSITYGIDVRQKDDPYIKVVRRAVEPLAIAAIPGAFLVDTFPILKRVPEWMPGAGFKVKARVWNSYMQEMLQQPYEATKKKMAAGICPPCLTSISLGLKKSSHLLYSEEMVQMTAGAMYAAGAETSAAVLASCVLGLLTRPDVVKKAQQDLDRVVTPGHFPIYEDEASLPLITAITKETMRWRVITPLGIPHHLAVDDQYNGYLIPHDSIIIANSWAMLHDEIVYPEPSKFKPERFIKDGKLDMDIRDPAHAVWGFGRRICPGRFIAFPAVWTAIASLLYVFDIEKQVDGTGSAIEPSIEDTVGVLNMPEPFPYSITPRSPEFEKLIRESRKPDLS